jgi:hypothetical protein
MSLHDDMLSSPIGFQPLPVNFNSNCRIQILIAQKLIYTCTCTHIDQVTWLYSAKWTSSSSYQIVTCSAMIYI